MDCFNFFCSLRQNTTSNYNYCGHLACQNRHKEPFIYTTLTTDETTKTDNKPDPSLLFASLENIIDATD